MNKFIKINHLLLLSFLQEIFKIPTDQEKRSFDWEKVHASDQAVHTMRQSKAQNMEETFEELRDEQNQNS